EVDDDQHAGSEDQQAEGEDLDAAHGAVLRTSGFRAPRVRAGVSSPHHRGPSSNRTVTVRSIRRKLAVSRSEEGRIAGVSAMIRSRTEPSRNVHRISAFRPTS